MKNRVAVMKIYPKYQMSNYQNVFFTFYYIFSVLPFETQQRQTLIDNKLWFSKLTKIMWGLY